MRILYPNDYVPGLRQHDVLRAPDRHVEREALDVARPEIQQRLGRHQLRRRRRGIPVQRRPHRRPLAVRPVHDVHNPIYPPPKHRAFPADALGAFRDREIVRFCPGGDVCVRGPASRVALVATNEHLSAREQGDETAKNRRDGRQSRVLHSDTNP